MPRQRPRRSSAWCCVRARSTTTCWKTRPSAAGRRCHHPRGTAVPVPARAAGGRTEEVRQGHRRGVDAGRTAEPGRVVPDPPPPAVLRPMARACTTPVAPVRPPRLPVTWRTTSSNSRSWSPMHWSTRSTTRSLNNFPLIPEKTNQKPRMATEVKAPVLPESVADGTIATAQEGRRRRQA